MEKYAVLVGAWGDVQVSLQECFKRNFRKIILLSNQKYIENFLLAQDFIDEVIKFPFNTEFMDKLNDGDKVFSEYCSHLKNKKIETTSFLFDDFNNTNRYDIYKNLKLDDESIEWAKNTAKKLPSNFILFHPYSIGNSCPKNDHWKHWESLIEYYVKKKNNIVLCGQNIDFSFLDNYENFYDLTNSTDSFQKIFALCHYAEKIIMTSNGLSFYCASNNLKSLVIMNKSASNYFSGFNRAIFSENVIKIDFDCPFLEAISIIENDKKSKDLFEILACFPYLHRDNIYDSLQMKNNEICQKIKQGHILSLYSENGFEPIIFANMILKNKRFIYHIRNYNEQEEYKIIENVKYFIDRYNRDIDFKFITSPIMDYDLILKKIDD
jgi:hypothetical protein